MKRYFLVLLVSFSIFFIFGNTTSAESSPEEDLESMNIYETIDIEVSDFSSFRTVSEEEVILDYMLGQNVARSIAIKELGIDQEEDRTSLASCTTTWKEITTGKQTIDKGSKSTLELFPYVQIKNCGNNVRPEILSVSGNVRHNVESFFGKGAIVFTNKDAVKVSKHVFRARASGYIKNFLGLKVRDWDYEGQVTMKAAN